MTEHATATEIISALRRAASAEQTAALVAALYVARSRAADSTPTSAYQGKESSGSENAAAQPRAERRLRAA
ncbi:MAG TPA: hypothetical protein VFU74_11555 [Actinocrinis sp.]|nr:hypothetical protein [Actinocrinis sp.]